MMGQFRLTDDMLVNMAQIGVSEWEIVNILNIQLDNNQLEFLRNNRPIDWEKISIRRFKRYFDNYSVELKNRLRMAIRGHIADMIIREMGNVETLIGYPIELLLVDFELKFKDDMNWDNWGKWQIDHIKPRRMYNTNQIKDCFKLDNLQPLWKTDNIRKH